MLDSFKKIGQKETRLQYVQYLSFLLCARMFPQVVRHG